jgi:hypothetical protein
VKFEELKSYFVHADIGAPIVCPLKGGPDRTDLFSYIGNDESSLKEAFTRAALTIEEAGRSCATQLE